MNDDDETYHRQRDDCAGRPEFGEDVLERVLAGEHPDQIFSDRDWAAHDAEVQRKVAVYQEAERAAELGRRGAMLKAEGAFPARAVDAARVPWPTETLALQRAREFIVKRKSILVLAGGVGTGKTSAATWVALEAGGRAPAFLRASEVESRGRYDCELRSWLRGRTMLVLDDLGAEVLDGKGVFRSFFDEVVDVLYGDHKLLVITTNLRARRESLAGEPQFVERYGDRVVSRMRQSGSWADCGGRDLRRDQIPLDLTGRGRDS